MKKIILFVVVLGLAGAGFFYWWNNQADVRELNKTLPEGVKVVKSLFGEEYKIVNKIDGYEFKIPPEWEGIKKIEYFPRETEQGYIVSSIGLEGKEGVGRVVDIAQFQIEDSNINLEFWVKAYFEKSGLINEFEKEMVGNFEVVKTREFIMPIGYVYFLKNDFAIYSIVCGSENSVRYIITHGRW